MRTDGHTCCKEHVDDWSLWILLWADNASGVRTSSKGSGQADWSVTGDSDESWKPRVLEGERDGEGNDKGDNTMWWKLLWDPQWGGFLQQNMYSLFVIQMMRAWTKGGAFETQVWIKFEICNFVSSEFEVMEYATDRVLDNYGDRFNFRVKRVGKWRTGKVNDKVVPVLK
jgi:hypothetical protein